MKRLAICAAAVVALAAFAAPATASVPKLPKKFIWGVSSSGFQSEGSTTGANWNTYIARDPTKQAYRNSVDFFHRYPGDVKLAKGLGVNTYRVSINWTRVEPRKGQFSEAGLRFYDRVFKKMRAAGIQPLITLNHWDYPMWVYDQGGWADGRTVDDFIAMTKVVAKRYRSYARYWLTFNEEFFFEFIETGNYPYTPVQTDAMRANLVTAHRRAYDLIHQIEPGAQVSTNYAWPGKGALASLDSDAFMNAVADKLDYFGVDYYYPAYDQTTTLVNLSAGTAWKNDVDPFGMYTALRTIHRRFPKLPVLITENGMGTDNGAPRADGVTRQRLLQDTLYWVQRARQDGVPVIGYMYWSLTDNYEWGSYEPRFGLYTVDVATDPALKRKPTPAVPTFKRMIRGRGVAPGYRLVQKPAASNCETASVAAEDRPACRAASG